MCVYCTAWNLSLRFLFFTTHLKHQTSTTILVLASFIFTLMAAATRIHLSGVLSIVSAHRACANPPPPILNHKLAQQTMRTSSELISYVPLFSYFLFLFNLRALTLKLSSKTTREKQAESCGPQ